MITGSESGATSARVNSKVRLQGWTLTALPYVRADAGVHGMPFLESGKLGSPDLSGQLAWKGYNFRIASSVGLLVCPWE